MCGRMSVWLCQYFFFYLILECGCAWFVLFDILNKHQRHSYLFGCDIYRLMWLFFAVFFEPKRYKVFVYQENHVNTKPAPFLPHSPQNLLLLNVFFFVVFFTGRISELLPTKTWVRYWSVDNTPQITEKAFPHGLLGHSGCVEVNEYHLVRKPTPKNMNLFWTCNILHLVNVSFWHCYLFYHVWVSVWWRVTGHFLTYLTYLWNVVSCRGS